MENLAYKEILLNSAGIPRLNYFLSSFPDLDPLDFGNFLQKDSDGLEAFHYILNGIYPILLDRNTEDALLNLQKMKTLINEFSDDTLIPLWNAKVNNLSVCSAESESLTYFSLIEQERILGLIIYVVHLLRDYHYHLDCNSLRKIASSLVIFLEEDTVLSLIQHEFFRDILDDLKGLFKQEELAFLLKMKPELSKFLESDFQKSEKWTQVSEDGKHDICAVLSMMELDYMVYENKLARNLIFHSASFQRKGPSSFFKLEHIIRLLKKFPPQRQALFFEELLSHPNLSQLVGSNDREIVQLMIQDRFKMIEELQNLRMVRKTSLNF